MTLAEVSTRLHQASSKQFALYNSRPRAPPTAPGLTVSLVPSVLDPIHSLHNLLLLGPCLARP